MKKSNFIIRIIFLIVFFFSGGGIIFLFTQKSAIAEQTSNSKKQSVDNFQSPLPVPNNNYSNKTLAKTIKTDLRDALTNESRQIKYFTDYQVFDDGDIRVRAKNKELKRELRENFYRNYAQRKEKFEKGKIDHIKKHGSFPNDFEEGWEKFEVREVWKSDLEPNDHQEIVDLVRRISELTIEKAERPFHERMKKLNSNNKLFESAIRAWECPWKNGRYVTFLGKGKGKSYNLAIPENHPALALLKPGDEKERFYWIEGAENIPIVENPPSYLGSDDNNGNNYHKWVSLTDKIIITLADF